MRNGGLPFVELIADADNIPSQRVIEANGGRLIEAFHKSASSVESLRFRIVL
jgi:predicted acetyltransferase